MGHQLFRSGGYGPETLATLYKVFDRAWEEVSVSAGALPQDVEAARWRLATVIMELASTVPDLGQLKDLALETFKARQDRTPA